MTEQPFSSQLVAGDSWSWSVSPLGYSPSSYTLKYFLRGPKSLDIAAIASPAGTGFLVTAVPADTSGLVAGIYAWSMCVFAVADNKRTELGRGTVEVLPDLAAVEAGAIDPRSSVKKTLDSIRAVLEGRAGRVEAEYQINGRQLRLLTLKELIDAEGYFTARYRREQIESGQLPANTNQVYGAFGDASNPVLVRLWKNVPGSSS